MSHPRSGASFVKQLVKTVSWWYKTVPRYQRVVFRRFRDSFILVIPGTLRFASLAHGAGLLARAERASERARAREIDR